MKLSFDGQVAIVTGGLRGIGKATADLLQERGCHVVRWGLTRGIIVDVRHEKDVADAVDGVLDNYGRIDILINNAGVFGPVKSALDYTIYEWNGVFADNLTSQLIVMKAVIPHMVKNGYGRVVNLASVVGRDANPMAPAYSAAKAGVIRLTQAIGRELATTGVLVNCVAPSATNTDLFRHTPQAQLDIMKAKVPMGRFAEPSEVAELICWLASSEMTYSAGAVFDCSGGRHE